MRIFFVPFIFFSNTSRTPFLKLAFASSSATSDGSVTTRLMVPRHAFTQVKALGLLLFLVIAFARNLKGPGIQQLQGDCLPVDSRQVSDNDDFITMFPHIDAELPADRQEHAVVHSSGRQEPAAG